MKRLKPQLVYVTPNACGGAFYKDFVVVQLLKAMGCKVVAHYHNKGVATRQDRKLDSWLYRRFFKGIRVMLLAEPLVCGYGAVCKAGTGVVFVRMGFGIGCSGSGGAEGGGASYFLLVELVD